MKKLGQTSPMRLACWNLIGILLILTGFVRELMHVLLSSGGPWSGKWIWLGPYVFGMGMILIAERQLRGQVWTDEELGPLRRLMAYPAWNVLIWIPIVALLIMLFIRRLEHHMGLGVFLILPSQMVIHLQQIVKPKSSSGRLLAGQSLAPIRSEHWGEPR
jgi:hypothetical protein